MAVKEDLNWLCRCGSNMATKPRGGELSLPYTIPVGRGTFRLKDVPSTGRKNDS